MATFPTKRQAKLARTKARKAKKSKASPTLDKEIKRVVVKELHRNIENKTYEYQTPVTAPANIYQIAALSLANWNSSNVIPLSPYTSYVDITQGTGQGNRIGNRIRIVKAMLNMVMYPAQYDPTTNPSPTPQDVTCYIVSYRDSNLKVDLTNALASSFFQSGNTVYGLNGYLSDAVGIPNRDLFIVKHKFTVKLGFALAGGGGVDSNNQSYANNDYKYNQIIRKDITKYLPKSIIYNDTDAVPASQSVWLVIDSVDANGTVPPNSATGYSGRMYYNIAIDYEDA